MASIEGKVKNCVVWLAEIKSLAVVQKTLIYKKQYTCILYKWIKKKGFFNKRVMVLSMIRRHNLAVKNV